VVACRVVAGETAPREDKILRLRVPLRTVNNRRIAEAATVIDEDGRIIKNRHGHAGRVATPEELAEATEVYG